ncbi:tRNA adenosine(34) deaminase TadA [Parvularcula sp. LCG005]|uniref:tRNA adenosine(34) deaminase TadA n=1 Tax=Parvularcula sp. LCG005 TaxID=3078805 RepID=UPI00294240E2|nr:tRNA adenosine(34) deaminase TadA [Parvularcula sp. LCG005]WOI53900.1 tRNA adenosine(34) deaminase TadA [Parvularcula sp. LCG005]
MAELNDMDVRAWMTRALALADQAASAGEVPVGAVILDPDMRLLAEAANQPIGLSDPSAHAELLAIRKAAAVLGNYRLTGCTLIVTLEPCAMCAGALSHARLAHVIYGASDPKGGAVAHGPKLFDQPTIHHRPLVTDGVMADECGAVLKSFFAARRR